MHIDSFRGVIVPAVTPFRSDLSLDEPALERVLAHFDAHPGVDGLFITGSTGEYGLLTLDERKRVIDAALGMGLKKPWLVNTSTRRWASSMELTAYAASRGIGAVGAILPEECRGFDDALRYLGDLRTLGVGVFIYQTGDTPYQLSVEEMKRVLDLGGILGMKDSCSTREFNRHLGYIAACGDRMTVIQGVEMLYLSSLVMGARGVIGGGCNVYPQLIRRVGERFLSGDLGGARADQELVNVLVEQLYEEGSGPESMKYCLSLAGVDVGWHSRRGAVVSERKKALMRSLAERVQSMVSPA